MISDSKDAEQFCFLFPVPPGHIRTRLLERLMLHFPCPVLEQNQVHVSSDKEGKPKKKESKSINAKIH